MKKLKNDNKDTFQKLRHLLTEVKVKGDALTDTYNRLTMHVAESGLTFRDEVPKDGNCMFHAVCDQLFRTERDGIGHVELRKLAVDFLKDRPYNDNGDHLSVFVQDQSWEDYLDTMSRDGTWGDHIVLQAIADKFGHDVSIVSSVEAKNYVTILTPSSRTLARHDTPLLLGHYAENHYASLDVAIAELEAAMTIRNEKKGEEQPKPPTKDSHYQPDLGVSGTTDPDLQATYMKAANIFRKQHDQLNVTGTEEYPLISIWDFGGQEIFYSTQQVFYTHRAIYGMILDLTKPLDSTVEKVSSDGGPTTHCHKERDFIDYHLESIRAHTRPLVPHCGAGQTAAKDIIPPVMVIFTHKDQVTEKCKQAFYSATRNHLKGKVIDKHVIDRYFSVDNTRRNPEDPEVAELRHYILDLAKKQSYMGESIPIKWLEVKSALQGMHKKGKRYCTLQEVMEAIDNHPIETTPEENAVNILKFWHLCGDIIYFPLQILRNFVILEPQWFVEVCKTIITIPQFRDREVKDEWDRLQETGELHDHLIEHVWSHREEALRYNLIDHKEELLDMMEKFDLVLRCHGRGDEETGPKYDTAEQATYFVPALLTTVTDDKKLYPSRVTRSKPIFIVFDGKFCPIGLYHRIVISSMRRYFKKKPLAYASCARFITSNPRQTFIITKEKFYLKVELLSSIHEDARCFSHGPEVREGLDEDLREVIEKWAPGIRYEWCLRCSCDDHKVKGDVDRFLPIQDREANIRECFKNGNVDCETYAPATTTVQDAGLADWFQNPLPEDDRRSPARPENPPSVDVSRYFDKVVDEVSSDWDNLARKLGFERNEIKGIKDEEGDNNRRCREVLERWRNKQGNVATLQVLKRALIEIGHKRTANLLGDSSDS
ncbi:Hypp4559 [Branchiostoma lanceolatum]|uniref:Hypp4559 protein n=1 Tax=Branchiostoma lanceolatum TaxID=7740 RepID=A0A8K0A863_BRALA|nr:Hypp4559 [Branchiostoma lanceolatum]